MNLRFNDGFLEECNITEDQQKVYMFLHNDDYYVCLKDGMFAGYVGQVDGDIRGCPMDKAEFLAFMKQTLLGKDFKVYVGRIYDPKRHKKENAWSKWKEDVLVAEKILIYIYSPNYNSSGVANPPELKNSEVRLIHAGERGALECENVAPRDLSG